MKMFFLLTLAFLSICGRVNAGTKESNILARCNGIYNYVAHTAQMQNNEGLAKNLLFRSSRTVTSLFMITAVDGVIKGERIEEFRSIQQRYKSNLDAGRLNLNYELRRCDQEALPITNRTEQAGGMLWGLTFQELQEQLFAKARRMMGIQ